MLFSTLVSYFAAIRLHLAPPDKRKLYLIAPILVDLLLLAVFKYAGFAADSLRGLAHLFQIPLSVPYITSSCGSESRFTRSIPSLI